MLVSELIPSLEPKYRAFVSGRPDALVYHSIEYRDLLQDVMGGEARYFVVTDQAGEIRAALPTFLLDGPDGIVLNSLPYYGSNGGILADSKPARDAALAHYNAVVSDEGLASATIISNPFNDDEIEDACCDFTDERIGQMSRIDAVAEHEHVLMGRFHQKTRNAIRKAEKSGVTVSCDNEAIASLSRFHVDNMRDLGGTPKSARFFEALPKRFGAGEQYKIFIARSGDETIAALLVLFFGRTVEYYIPATRVEYRSLQPMSLLIFRAMVDASRSGFAWWNWGGTWLSQTDLFRFKSRWGTVSRPYYYRTKLNNRALLKLTPRNLLERYPNSYVLPFRLLHREDGS